MHAGTVDTELGLRHKSSVQSMTSRNGAYGHLEGHDVVSRMDGIGILEVDLMLSAGHLVMTGLDLVIHLLQRQADLPPGALPVVQRPQSK